MSEWEVPVSMVDQAKEITRLQVENEALRQQLAEVLSAERKFAVNFGEAFILRKQAEAVDEAVIHVNNLYGHDDTRFTDFSDYAQTLRTQAAELERQSVEGGLAHGGEK